MKKALLIFNFLFLIILISCGDEKTNDRVNLKDHKEVARLVSASLRNGNLSDYKKVSTADAYDQFKVEVELLGSQYNPEITANDMIIRADTIINNIAWVSLKSKNEDVHRSLRLEKIDGNWKYAIYNLNKEKSPLKNEVISFPELK